MSAKFFVWGGGRWREVSLEGCVEGWGRVQFAAATRGRLQLVRRAAVLRGLRDLAAGTPSTVRDGPQLSQLRLKDVKTQKKAERCEHCCQQQHPALPAPRVNSDDIFNRLLKSTTSVAIQCGTADIGVQVDDQVTVTNPTEQYGLPIADRKNQDAQSKRSKRLRPVSPETRASKRANNGTNKEWRVSENTQRSQERRENNQSATSPQAYTQTCKELVIQEEDVELLRRFIESDGSGFLHADLLKFDENDNYKKSIFYKLNPIVTIARCARIDRMLREKRSRTTDLSLNDFVTMLGLRSVKEVQAERNRRLTRSAIQRRSMAMRSPTLTDDTDKENFTEQMPRATNDRTTKVLKDNNDTKRNFGESSKQNRDTVNNKNVLNNNKIQAGGSGMGRAVGSGRADNEEAAASGNKQPVNTAVATRKTADKPVNVVKQVREYSPLEDAAIVALVSSGARASRVNGNRLWRELQPHFRQRTGRFRSWHSLRNRYLRHVLPRLGALLPPAHAARLRAAAAAGEIKSRKLPALRNSLLVEPRVRSAWSRRPRPPPHSPSPSPTHSPSPPPPAPRHPPASPSSRSSRGRSVSSPEMFPSSDTSAKSDTNLRRSGRLSNIGTQVKAVRRLRSSAAADTHAHTPTHTQTHAQTHTSTPTHTPTHAQGRRGRRATPTYSEVTRRFASRSDHSQPPPRGQSPRKKTRRLYNPKDALS